MYPIKVAIAGIIINAEIFNKSYVLLLIISPPFK